MVKVCWYQLASQGNKRPTRTHVDGVPHPHREGETRRAITYLAFVGVLSNLMLAFNFWLHDRVEEPGLLSVPEFVVIKVRLGRKLMENQFSFC